jgi:hypothetical protein
MNGVEGQHIMGFLDVLTSIPSTHWLRVVAAFASAALLTRLLVGSCAALLFCFFHLKHFVEAVSTHYTGMLAFRLLIPENPKKLSAKFSLSNCAWLTTERWAR